MVLPGEDNYARNIQLLPKINVVGLTRRSFNHLRASNLAYLSVIIILWRKGKMFLSGFTPCCHVIKLTLHNSTPFTSTFIYRFVCTSTNQSNRRSVFGSAPFKVLNEHQLAQATYLWYSAKIAFSISLHTSCTNTLWLW